MRYNQIINEANYKNKFDLANPLTDKAAFEAATKALGATILRPSKPQAGGAIYYIDDKVGIVGFRVPDGEGFKYYLAKEAFMPSKKNKGDASQSVTKATTEPLTLTAIRPRNPSSGYSGVAFVTFNRPATYDEVLNLLLSKPGMDPKIGASSDNSYKASALVYSKVMSERQLRDSLHGIKPTETVKPKAEPKPAAKVATPEDALYEIKSMMKSAMSQSSGRGMSYGYGGSYSGEYRDIEEHDGRWLLDVRYWGSWHVPSDVSDEDAQDYDWEVLDRDWRAKMEKIVADVATKYPTIQLSWSTEEKNYISVWASLKK